MYLAVQVLEYNKDSTKHVVTSAGGQMQSDTQLVFEDNGHEADTLLIYQAVLAAERNSPNAQMTFFSPDTMLVLVIANYNVLPEDTSVAMASGTVKIQPVWSKLGESRAKALPALHAFSGADNTGKFADIGKAMWFQLFLKADEHIRLLETVT